MADAAQMNASERLFRDDVVAGAFAAGADRGYWRLVWIQWPVALIEIAASPRPRAPGWYALRFELTGYPAAPTAQPWDVDAGRPLDPRHWPAGGDRITRAFNPSWRSDALYLPVDRIAQDGHEAWRAQAPSSWWDSAGDITQYLRVVHDMLNEEDYAGVRG